MDDIKSMDFWDRLDEMILTKGFTRKAVAKDLGFSVGNFGSWKARGDFPTADKLAAIAGYLGTTVEYLLTGDYSRQWGLPPLVSSVVVDLLRLEDSDLRRIGTMIHALVADEEAGPPAQFHDVIPELKPLPGDLDARAQA